MKQCLKKTKIECKQKKIVTAGVDFVGDNLRFINFLS